MNRARLIKLHSVATAFVSMLILMVGAVAQTLPSSTVFEGTIMAPAKDGSQRTIHISVQSWGLIGHRGQSGSAEQIPLRGFYVAHLISGHIVAVIDGQTAEHQSGDYWTVKSGAVMQITLKEFGEAAVLETIVLAEQ